MGPGAQVPSRVIAEHGVAQQSKQPKREVSVFPVREVNLLHTYSLALALALAFGETVQSNSAVEEAIRWVHQLSGLTPIVESPWCEPQCLVYRGNSQSQK